MPRRDDSFLDRFDAEGVRHDRARDGVVAIVVAALLLIVLAGDSVRSAADRLPEGVGRSVVEAVGGPTGWVADRFPLAEARRKLTAPLSPDTELAGEGLGFDATAAAPTSSDASASAEPPVPAVTVEAFDPAALGAEPEQRPQLASVLVTGDSMSKPLDEELARQLTGSGVETIREPHLGTGITIPEIVDWGRLAATQVERHEPDAVVMFLGAGDAFPLPGADGALHECCGPEWAAVYATRARQMMNTYRREGAARVYWLTIPAARNPDRDDVTRVVNQAIEVAAQPWRSQVRVVDLVPVITPGGEYSDSLEIDGTERLVRASDGLHLNDAGAELAATAVLELIDADFER